MFTARANAPLLQRQLQRAAPLCVSVLATSFAPIYGLLMGRLPEELTCRCILRFLCAFALSTV
jgi:hypothetical protein